MMIDQKPEITIAVDAMGGDRAPEIVVKGIERAMRQHPEARYILFGDADQVRPLLDGKKALNERVRLVHTDKAVDPHAKAAQVARQRGTSMRMAIEAVKAGEADCALSAGSTGALMSLSYLILRALPGIDRPAIASFFPTLKGESCMLDLGANLSVNATNLVQFALMGNVFARVILGVRYPTYGLLNIGSEDTKGFESIQEAAVELTKISDAEAIPGSYVGYIEGDGVAAGSADVVVADGFTGNVALKMGEGTARLTTEYLRRTFRSSFMAQLGYLFAFRQFRKLRYRLDPRRYNGAIFLGLNGIVVKSHGGTDDVGFANAIGVAADMVAGDVVTQIRAGVDAVNTQLTETPAAE